MIYDPIRTYFRQIGRVALLSQEQEVFLGKQVQAMMSLLAAKKSLAQQLHREPTPQEWALQVAQSEAALTETLALGQQAKCQMVKANLRLVIALAKRYRERGVDFQDLIQEGAIGLQRVVRLLNDLHFLALHNLTDIHLGSELLFWFHYTQALKRLICKDQYIPALKYRELKLPEISRTKGKSAQGSDVGAGVSQTQSRRKSAATAKKTQQMRTQEKAKSQTIDITAEMPADWEIYPGWELIGEEYEMTIQQYVEYMPLACVSGFTAARATPQFYDRETLLRHFSECLLTDIVTQTPSTQAFEKTIADSLLYNCLHPTARKMPRTAAKLEQYQQWQTWRDRIVRTQSNQPFYLCFQLQDPNKPEDPWQLQFQVAPKSDPSLRVSLGDYWRMRSKQQQQVQKQLGQDFEQHLLMNLGYAARIYPQLWHGLETDRPEGISLDLEATISRTSHRSASNSSRAH